ncbi:GNAT family N-acetyltransferase [Microvirga sp. M2]|uniref:GNAT family N-acetyltransferase n=1 Tax=Microvirga sp. M2 TaxID=3073270 RepID=UPI0039C4A1AA
MTPEKAMPALEIIDGKEEGFHRTIFNGYCAFNAKFFPDRPAGQELAIALRDPQTGKAIGGLTGHISGGWLVIELFFVPDEFRDLGLATRLITKAEEEAIRQGCHSARLDTHNPKAMHLCRRLGYVVFGELDDYPVRSSRTLYLRKKLG